MDSLRGRTALVTGATGGIGKVIVRRLADRGVNVVVTGRRADVLAESVHDARAAGVDAAAVAADLADPTQVEPLLERAEAALGPIDILVNNAGIEHISPFVELTADDLATMVHVNLTAPMVLTRAVLGGMLARGRGHVVFVSSMAGKVGLAYGEPYAATKGGLILLTQSLRAEFAGEPVGFSAVCPGFVTGDGMFERIRSTGVDTNRLLGSTTTDKVAKAVVTAIERDRVEVLVNSTPTRPLYALAQLAPKLTARIIDRTGANAIFHRVAMDRAGN